MNRREVIELGALSYINEIRKLWKVNRALGARIKKLESERPKGHWIIKWSGNGWNEDWDYTCSVCGKEYEKAGSVLYHSSYCPNCGADMRPKLVGKHADVTIIDEACMKGADDERR